MANETPQEKAAREKREKEEAERKQAESEKGKQNTDETKRVAKDDDRTAPRKDGESREDFNERQGKGPSVGELQDKN